MLNLNLRHSTRRYEASERDDHLTRIEYCSLTSAVHFAERTFRGAINSCVKDSSISPYSL